MMRAEFDHPGLLYRDLDEYLAGTTEFVYSAVAAGDAVLVAVPGGNLAPLRDSLADVADAVIFADMTVAGRNPGRIIPGVLLAFAAAHAGRRVSIIGEPIWPERSDVEYPACAAHEALINSVFAGRDAAILCPYDAVRLDDDRLRDAWRTHPVMITGGDRRPSPWYTDPLATAARFNQPLPPVPAGAAVVRFASVRDLARIRSSVAAYAERAGLPAARADDLVAAVNELAENTILYTPAGGVVSVWAEAGHLACQVDDDGHLADVLAGRVPPAAHVEGGRGLLLANLLCDLVRIHTRPGGTSIRLHMAG
ncbi:sensor histidine kinase [Actinoplanes aureus]|uniref:Sensor histidine kinase n=1 Tax=Actinoplanes aureus TaxID=2792083 RepID=A0A931C5A0_9ACTN|nr:sensor histidine kinase [Actinoplanes aureus]MBG0562489.1 sensor histidine kinase [Actinoplanes aureus]